MRDERKKVDRGATERRMKIMSSSYREWLLGTTDDRTNVDEDEDLRGETYRRNRREEHVRVLKKQLVEPAAGDDS